MEFKMTTDLEQALPAVIEFNFDELKAELTDRLDHYNHLVVTEDTIKEAKDDRAKLRKLREAIETRRKDVKRQCEQPYKAFEARVKELTALIDAPIVAIDGQVKGFEEQQREQKKDEIKAAYEELVPYTLWSIIPPDRILDTKWLNKNVTMKSIREAIETTVKRTKVDIALINGVEPQYKTAVWSKYLATLDVDLAMEEQNKLMAAEQALQQSGAARAAYQPPAKEEPPVAAQEPAVTMPEPATEERLYLLKLEMHLTKAQADHLKAFLSNEGINYRNITNQH